MSITRWVKKMWDIYTVEYSPQKKTTTTTNETRALVKIWVDLESVIHSKVSQKEKKEYYKSTVQINCIWSA